jgi:hypothetical protein
MNQEIFQTSPNVTSMIKSRTFRWARHIPHMEAMMNAYRVSVGRIILKWILKEQGTVCNGSIWLKTQPSGSIKC